MEHKVDLSLEQIEEIAPSWRSPNWARGWLVEGRLEGRVIGRVDGREEGRAEYRAALVHAIQEALRHRIRLSFDPETARPLVRCLGSVSDPRVLLKASREMDTGATGADLLQYFDRWK